MIAVVAVACIHVTTTTAAAAKELTSRALHLRVALPCDFAFLSNIIICSRVTLSVNIMTQDGSPHQHVAYFSFGYLLGLVVLFVGVLVPLAAIVARNRKIFTLS